MISSFCQIHQGRLLIITKIPQEFIIPSWNHLFQTHKQPKKPPKSVRIIYKFISIVFIPLQSYFFVIRSAFTNVSTSVRIKQLKIFCFELSLRLSFKKIWIIQKLLYIPLRIALDKTHNTNGRKIFRISILPLFQFIFIKFDTDKAPEKSDCIWIFWEKLKPLVKAQTE